MQNREDILALYGLVEGVDDKVDALAAQTEAGFAASVERDDAMSARVDGVNVRVGELSARVGELSARVDGMNVRVDGVRAQVDGVRAQVTGLDTKLDEVLELLGRRG